MIAVVLAIAAGTGTWLVWTALALGRRGLGPRRGALREPARRTRGGAPWRALGDVPRDALAASCALGLLGSLGGYGLFGGIVPALGVGAFAAAAPFASVRVREEQRRAAALEAWPRMIEEIRIRVGSVGRSIPQALFEVGLSGPEPLRPAFAAARREWSITTDFERTLAVLKARLADPTADAVCETLLIAHEIGGTDVERRLDALAEDRRQDLNGRKDARSRQAGARFARRFVLLVPAGMALAGMSVGTGRAAYATPTGQVLVSVALALVVACWVWAGRIMRLPTERRVFDA